ncbi:MAG: hypothetical protein IJH63_03060 [Methanobrevibacter sp.]|nr:hypothetical protein [Methanobrevibacter sp.]
MYIEGIIDRLNNPYLKSKNNDGRLVLDGTIGEYLENYNNNFKNYFLSRASGKWLDLHGLDYGILRLDNESDKHYRERIMLINSILMRILDFNNLNINLWVYDSNVAEGNDYLTSRNTYLQIDRNHGLPNFLGYADDFTKEYVSNKFIGGEILWLD